MSIRASIFEDILLLPCFAVLHHFMFSYHKNRPPPPDSSSVNIPDRMIAVLLLLITILY